MTREQLIAVALVAAPVPLVVIIALLRGYTITVHFRRKGKDEP